MRWPDEPGSTTPSEAHSDGLRGIELAGLEPPSRAADFASLEREYQRYFNACEVVAARTTEADKCCDRIEANRTRYTSLGDSLSIPWYVIGLLHLMECGCDFGKHLHNGDPLRTRTTHKPEGRPLGPPSAGLGYSWEESASDALRELQGIRNWSVARFLFEAEKYNGRGYRSRGLPSAYLWSGSNLYAKGKFTSDSVFDPEAVSRQLGIGTVLSSTLSYSLAE